MAPPISKRSILGAKLAETKHPKHPERYYTITEAAKKAKTSRAAVYRQIKRNKQGEKNEQ